MLEILSQPWPWYVGGPAIAIIVFLLLRNGRAFGISSSLETMCSLAGAGKIVDYFNRDWTIKSWLLIFATGTILGGAIANYLLPNPNGLMLSESTVATLAAEGLRFDAQYLPAEVFNWSNLFTLQGVLLMIVGGVLVGFGTRYAGGCTSGHAISGLANLQLPSLVATIGFFIGGLISTYLFLPYIRSL